MMLELKGVYAGYSKGENVIKDLSCTFLSGTVTAVIGANGSGKSTLLKAIARQIKISQGSIALNSKDVRDYDPKALARNITILPQVRNVPSIPARALVMHGRFPYMSFPRIPSSADKAAVKKYMQATDTLDFADLDVATLSGGQRQRVYIAMLLAQETDVILMDEPTTFLDIGCQFETLELIKGLKHDGKCVVVVLHDIAQAMQISDNILFVADGQRAFYGTSYELLKSGTLEKYMHLSPRKVDGEDVYYFKRTD